MKIIPFSFALCPPRWSLKKRRKNVGLEHKGRSLGLARWKKRYYRWILIRTCIKNAICKIAFWWNVSSHAFCLRIFTKMCSLLPPEAHFWKPMLSKMPSKMLVLSHFGVHWPFQSPSVGPSSATKNPKKCCSRDGLEHFFDLRPFFNHNLQIVFAISVTCVKKFDFWCLLAWFFFNFLQIL